MNKRKQSTLIFLLMLIMFMTLLPAAALAADPEYDNDPSHFSYSLYQIRQADDTYRYELGLDGYFGTSDYVQVPESVPLGTLQSLDPSYYNAAKVAAITDAGYSSLPVTRFERTVLDPAAYTSHTHIRLAANIEQIRTNAFTLFPNLLEVDIPADSKLKEIHNYAFSLPSLRRVGVAGSNKLPAGLKLIGDYSFYKCSSLQSIDLSDTEVTDIGICAFLGSGIESVVLPADLSVIGTHAFNDCAALTSVDIPASVTRMESYAFENCKSLTGITLRAPASALGYAYAAFKGVPEAATVYVNAPSPAEYSSLINDLYYYMGLNANVSLRWIGSGSAMTVPSVNAASAVTLTGDNLPAFSYDYNDSNADGLGGIITVTGRNSGWTLNIDRSYISNESRVLWYSAAAYYNGDGMENAEMLRGRALTDNMRRHSSSPVIDDSGDRSTVPLRLSFSEPLGIYYYFPLLINEGSAYTPQSSSFGPPIAVIYLPDSTPGNQTELTLKGGAGGLVSIPSYSGSVTFGDAYNELTKGLNFRLPGVENYLPFDTELVKGVTALDFGPNAQITYKWQILNGAVWEDVPGASGIPVYNGITQEGALYSPSWNCAGIPAAVLTGYKIPWTTHSLRIVIGGSVAGQSVEKTSGTYVYNCYGQRPDDKPFTFDTHDMTEMELTNVVLNPVFMSYAPGHPKNPYKMKRGTRNFLAVSSYTQADLGDFRGYLTYEWEYYLDGHSGERCSGGTAETFDMSLLPTDITSDTTYVITCATQLYDGDGISREPITHAYFYVKMLAEAAADPDTAGQPYSILDLEFDNSKQAALQLLMPDSDSGFDATFLRVDLLRGLMEEEHQILGETANTTFEIYEVDSPEQNRGGRLLFTRHWYDVPGSQYIRQNDNKPDYSVTPNGNDNLYRYIDGDDDIIVRMRKGSFALDLGYKPFDSYAARYIYVRAANIIDGKLYSVAYSPTFAVLPGYNAVKDSVPIPQSGMELVRAPERELWLAPDTDGDGMEGITLTAKLQLHNMPAAYQLPGDVFPLEWRIWNNECENSSDNAGEWTDYNSLGGYTDGDIQEIITDGITINPDGSYIISATARLHLDLYTASSGKSSFLYDDEAGAPEEYYFDAGEGCWRIALMADTQAFYNGGGPKATWCYSPVSKLYLAPEQGYTPRNITVSVSGNGAIGGKGIWDSTLNQYLIDPADAQGRLIIPEDELWVYSEEYDYRWPGTSGNQPATGELTVSANNVSTLNAGETFLWRVSELYNNPYNICTYMKPGDTVPLTAAGHLSNGALESDHYPEAALRAVIESGTPRLIIDEVHGTISNIRNLTFTPMVVTAWDEQNQSFSSAQIGPTLVLRVNRRIDTQKPSLSAGGYTSNVFINGSDTGAGLPWGKYVSVYDMQGITYYRLYRSLGSSPNLSADMPLGEWQPLPAGADNTLYHFQLTAADISTLLSDINSDAGSALYYIAAYNLDIDAVGIKRSEISTEPIVQVYVGDYPVLPAPVISEHYTNPATDYIPGNPLPEKLLSITVKAPWNNTETSGRTLQDIFLEYKCLDPDTSLPIAEYTGKVRLAGYSMDHTANAFSSSLYSGNPDDMTLTDNNNGSYTLSIKDACSYIAGLGKVLPAVGSRYDVELSWYVVNSVSDTDTEYATGGDISAVGTAPITVHQKPVEPAVIGAIALDAGAMLDNNIPKAELPYAMPDKPESGVQAFRQYGNAYRSVSFTVTAQAGLYIKPCVEYWNGTAWDTVGRNYASFRDAEDTPLPTNDGISATGEPQLLKLNIHWPNDWLPANSDTVNYFRVRIDASVNGNSASLAANRGAVFAMVEVPEEAAVNAEQPAAANDYKSSYFWGVDGADSRTSLPIGEDKWAVSDGGTLTYYWEQYIDGEYVLIPDITTPVYSLPASTVTEAIASAKAGGRPTLYFLVHAVNNNPKAALARTAESYKSIQVNFAKEAEQPVVISCYTGAAVNYIPGGTLPEGLFSITTQAPWSDTAAQGSNVTQYVSLVSEAYDPITHTAIAGSRAEHHILTLEKGYGQEPSHYSYYNSTVLLDNANTAALTLSPNKISAASLIDNTAEGYGISFDIRLSWLIENRVDNGSYDNIKQYETAPITVRQRAATAPMLSALSFDAGALTAPVTVGIPADTAFSSTPLSSVPAFRQYYTYYRPISFTAGGDAPFTVHLELQRWDDNGKYWYNTYAAFYLNGQPLADDSFSANGTAQSLQLELPADTGDITYYRLLAAARLNNNALSESIVCSDIFAVKPVAYEDVVNASSPIRPSSLNQTNHALWRVGGAAPTSSLTLDAGGWSSARGDLSYQWYYYDESTYNYIAIDGAASPVYTVMQSEVQELIDASAASAASVGQKKYMLRAANTDTHTEITGYRTSTDEVYFNIAFAQAAEVPVIGIDTAPVTLNTGVIPLTLTPTVSNEEDCSELSYSWYYRIISDGTGHPGYPQDTYPAFISTDEKLEWTVFKHYFNLRQWDDLLGYEHDHGSGFFAVRDSLWENYSSITVELWCEATNYDSSKTPGYESVSASSAPKTVTLLPPAQLSDLGSLSADKSILALGEAAALSLSGVSPANGGSMQYRWYSTTGNTFNDSSQLWFNYKPNYSPSAKDYADCTYYWVKAEEVYVHNVITEKLYGPIKLVTTGESAAAPVISCDNDRLYGEPDTDVLLSVTALSPDDGTLTYQWEIYDGNDWQTVTGANTPTLTVHTPASPGYDDLQYRITVTNTNTLYAVGNQTASASLCLTVTSDGVAVSGRVRSYDPGKSTTLSLYASTDTAHITPLYTAVIDAAAGSGQAEQSFSFDAVAAGTYDLVITKDGHLTYTVTGIAVGSYDLDLASLTSKPYSTVILLAGDVNGDGSITEDDVSVVRYTTNINRPTREAANALADVNGDGSVTEDDVSIIRYTTHINRSAAQCSYAF